MWQVVVGVGATVAVVWLGYVGSLGLQTHAPAGPVATISGGGP